MKIMFIQKVINTMHAHISFLFVILLVSFGFSTKFIQQHFHIEILDFAIVDIAIANMEIVNIKIVDLEIADLEIADFEIAEIELEDIKILNWTLGNDTVAIEM